MARATTAHIHHIRSWERRVFQGLDLMEQREQFSPWEHREASLEVQPILTSPLDMSKVLNNPADVSQCNDHELEPQSHKKP